MPSQDKTRPVKAYIVVSKIDKKDSGNKQKTREDDCDSTTHSGGKRVASSHNRRVRFGSFDPKDSGITHFSPSAIFDEKADQGKSMLEFSPTTQARLDFEYEERIDNVNYNQEMVITNDPHWFQNLKVSLSF